MTTCLIDVEMPWIREKRIGNKDYSLTYNTLFSGLHHGIRTTLTKKCKTDIMYVLQSYRVHNLKLETPCDLRITFYSKYRRFDVDNYGAIWAKFFLDVVKTKNSDPLALGIIPDDNARYVPQVSFNHVYTPDTDIQKIRFRLCSLDSEVEKLE